MPVAHTQRPARIDITLSVMSSVKRHARSLLTHLPPDTVTCQSVPLGHETRARAEPRHARDDSRVTSETTTPVRADLTTTVHRDFTPCIQPAGLLCRTGGATCPSDCDTQSLTQRRADSMSVNTRAGWTGDRLRTANAKLLRHSTPPDMIKATQRTRPAAAMSLASSRTARPSSEVTWTRRKSCT